MTTSLPTVQACTQALRPTVTRSPTMQGWISWLMCTVERAPRWKSCPILTKCPSARMTLSAPSHALRPSAARPSTTEPAPACTGGVAKLGSMPA